MRGRDRELLDALGQITAADEGIDRALRAGAGQDGRPDPMLLDLAVVDAHRDQLRRGLDHLESLRGEDRTTDEEYADRRRRRFGSLPG